MKRKIYSILILFCLNIPLGFTQETKGFKIPDSLKEKSFDEINKRARKAESSLDTLKALVYWNTYLQKAKQEDKKINVAEAFTSLSSLQIDDAKKLKYLDSAIVISKNTSYSARVYSYKGGYYHSRSDYGKALENYFFSLEVAEKNNSDWFVYSARYNIAALESKLGKYDKAIKGFKENLNQLHTLGDERDTLIRLIGMSTISMTFAKMKLKDSAISYITRGKKLAKLANSRSANNAFSYNLYYHFVLSEGINHFLNGSYKPALDSIQKALPFLSQSIDKNYFLNACLYLGKVNYKLNNLEEAKVYYQKVDSIYQSTGNVSLELREAYSGLVKYYKDKKDPQNQLFYIEKLLGFDSILNQNYKLMDKKLLEEYDIPNALAQKEDIIASLEAEKSTSTSQKAIISLLLVLSLGGSGYYYYTQRQYKRRFLQMLDTTQQDTVNVTQKEELKDKSESTGISQETRDHLLAQLEQFERNKGYIKPNINAKDLAKSFDSNSSYLSVVINTYKQKSISQYINDLRIDFAIQKLKADPKFRKYTIKAIAQEAGFNTAEAFSKAFYKKAKIYPSYFIKSLEKQD